MFVDAEYVIDNEPEKYESRQGKRTELRTNSSKVDRGVELGKEIDCGRQTAKRILYIREHINDNEPEKYEKKTGGKPFHKDTLMNSSKLDRASDLAKEIDCGRQIAHRILYIREHINDNEPEKYEKKTGGEAIS